MMVAQINFKTCANSLNFSIYSPLPFFYFFLQIGCNWNNREPFSWYFRIFKVNCTLTLSVSIDEWYFTTKCSLNYFRGLDKRKKRVDIILQWVGSWKCEFHIHFFLHIISIYREKHITCQSETSFGWVSTMFFEHVYLSHGFKSQLWSLLLLRALLCEVTPLCNYYIYPS